jgi:hypothetical protein
MGLANMLLARFAMVLGPMAIFGQALQSQSSGFHVLGKVVQILGALIGAFLLPAVAMIAGALLDLTDDIEEDLLAAAREFGAFVMGTLVPAVRFLADVISGTIDVFVWLGEVVGDVIGWFGDLIASDAESDAKYAAADDELKKMGLGGLIGAEGARARTTERDAAGGPPAGWFEKLLEKGTSGDTAGAGETREEKVKRSGIDDVIASLKMSMGPKASFSGLADVGKSAQLAALNADPIDQRLLRLNMRMVELLEDIRNGRKPGDRKPVYDTGRFSGGGAGGAVGGDF